MKLPQLSESLFDDAAESLLNIHVGDLHDPIEKSFYDFDVKTPEGIQKLLVLLPIMEDDLVYQVVADIWPGYPKEHFNITRSRLEIRGYLLDYLRSTEEEDE